MFCRSVCSCNYSTAASPPSSSFSSQGEGGTYSSSTNSCNETMARQGSISGFLKQILPCLPVAKLIIVCIIVSLTIENNRVLCANNPVGKNKSSAETEDDDSIEAFCNGRRWCSQLNTNERLSLEAIRYLHRQLDDDNNGSIDLKESNGFLQEELNYKRGHEKRHKNFHKNNDNQISVQDLWELWRSSEVHNWTTQQTVDWLVNSVHLPEYEQAFTDKNINGTYLPQLAANQHHFLSQYVGIRDFRHKQKVILKSQDAVLFGPPKDQTNRLKDMILTTSLAIALTIIWVVYRRYQLSQRDLNKMSKEMESLTKYEDELKRLQDELDKTKTEGFVGNGSVPGMGNGLNQSQSEELKSLKEEVEYLRQKLQSAEYEIQDKIWLPPPHLRQYLQLTYELETKAYNQKKAMAERQLREARVKCDKLREKRSSLIHAFVAANSRVVDEVDKAIVEAKTSLNEVTHEFRERMHRWKQIESLCNFQIVHGSGTSSMDSASRSLGSIGRVSSGGSTRSRPGSTILNDSRESLLE